MSADVLQKPSQVGFNFPSLNQPVSVPQRVMAGPDSGPAPHKMNQLQFNLGGPTSADQFTTRFRKPQPIIIEKLGDQNRTAQLLSQSSTTTPVVYPVVPSVSSSITSDRLALAVHLAKKDVRKVKEIGTENVLVSQEEETKKRHFAAAGKDSGAGKKNRVKGMKSKSQAAISEDKTTLRERVHSTVKKQEAEARKQYKMYFYPTAREDDEYESDGERTQANEIRKLRKELHQYMKQMESLKDERPQTLKNKDKRLKKRKEGEGRLADEDVDERQVVRAEEQAARSARMLYVLQRQVCEIEDELNKKKRGIKHTKKSQTLSRLAAAHRGAVRALQTFVSQAPLQPKVGHGLPPMYQELSALIRQLSLLAAQLHINGEDFSGEAKREKDHDEKVQFHSKDEPGKEEVVSRAIDKTPEKASAFIQEVADRKPRGTIKPRSPPKQVVTSSPDPTPERDAVLQAGLSALLRVKDTPVQTPVVKPKFQPRPAVQVEKPVKQASKKSLLLPAKLKLQRQKAFQTAKRVKLHHDVDQAHFAKGTVASILKKAPPVVGHQPVAQTRTPPRAPTWEGPHTPERVHYQGLHSLSPRSHRRQYETQKLQSPRSPKYARRILPTDLELIEREVARQRWLDEEAERRIRDLERERRLEVMQRHRRSPDVLLPKRLISETEDAIRSRLKPLLDRAEAIAETEAKREAGQKKSLQHQLGKFASQTTLNQADVLAEKVLDDILEDTVLEMQRLELEDDVQRQADNLQNSSTLENILQRLQSFEKAEEEIRQHWVQVNYADVEKSTENLPTGKRTQPAKDPKPIMFTRAVETESHRLLPGNARAPPDDDRRGVSEPFRLLNEISATSSFSSLMEERSFAQSSIYKSSQNSSAPQSRPLTSGTRPTVFLSVPKEMRASIVSYRNRFNKYLQDTSTHEEGTFDPWGLVNRISEELLEEALQEVGHELDNVCDVYAEALYNQEFVSVSSDA